LPLYHPSSPSRTLSKLRTRKNIFQNILIYAGCEIHHKKNRELSKFAFDSVFFFTVLDRRIISIQPQYHFEAYYLRIQP